jgi:hypothetical protein
LYAKAIDQTVSWLYLADALAIVANIIGAVDVVDTVVIGSATVTKCTSGYGYAQAAACSTHFIVCARVVVIAAQWTGW